MKHPNLNLLLITIIYIFNTGCNSLKVNPQNYRQTVEVQAQVVRNNRPDFFEKGRLQMEQEIQQLEVENPQPVLTIESGQIQWQNIIFKEGSFTIWMPAGTMTEETKVIETENGNIQFKVFASHPKSARFVVAYSPDLDEKKLVNPQATLTAVHNQIIDVTDFKIISDRPYNLGDYLGREFILENASETITFRIYLVDKRLYIIGASQTENNNQIPGAVETFLDSFKPESN